MIEGIDYFSAEIAEAIKGKMCGTNVKIEALTTNSKEKSTDPFCFFAIKGKNFNGADFIEEAIQNGSKLIITQEHIECSVTVIYVENVVKALGLLAKKHKGNTKIIAITGSNGKTTTKDMIVSVLKTSYSVCGTSKNLNNEIGVALTLLSIKNEDFCVVEMGMRGLGEIEWLSFIAEPNIGIITNCMSAHIGVLGNKKNIFKAKTEILKYIKEYAILPNERRFKRVESNRAKKCFVNYKSVKKIKRNEGSISFDINDCKNIEIDSIYEHDIKNAMLAYKLGKLLSIDDETIKRGLKNFTKQQNRGELFKNNNLLIVNDCYNASYESVKMAIISIKEHFKNKKIAVLLGDMLELGEKAEKLHFKIGKLCKKLKIDKFFVYGNYAKYYLKGFRGGKELTAFCTIKENVFAELKESYVLLIKASNSMNFEKIIDRMREKNDKFKN